MKKLVSLALVMVMVLSLFTIVPFSASAADTKTVYFQNNWMWTDVKVYYWGSSSTNSATWPGDTPQLVGNDGVYDVYAATVPTDIAGIIFNGFDGGTGSLNQTPDILDSANGDCYYMIWENQNKVGKDSITNILPNIVTPTSTPTPMPTTGPTPSGSKTVYFQNNWLWTDVKAYFWGSSSTNSAEWPGDSVQVVSNDGTYDYYSVTVPSDVAGVIFNGMDGGIGALNQTPDITAAADGDCYAMVWNEAEGKNGVEKVPYIVGPTTAPETQAPVTEAPETQAPETQPEVDGAYVKVGDKLYKVNKGDTFTYNYYLSVDSSLKISSLDINMLYDTEGLDIAPFTDEYGDVDLTKHFPNINGGVVHNFAIDGEIYYNYSSVAGIRLVDDALIFTAQFEVTADKGIYEISEKIITLADSDMNKIVYNEEVIQDVYTDKVTVDGLTPSDDTQAPETTPVVDDGLYVVADGEKFAVNKGDVVTYNYYLSVDSSLKISSLDINMFYDTEGLDFLPYTDEYGDVDMVKHFPIISGGCVNNFGIDGEIYYNYSSVAGTRLANNALVFTGQFKVTAEMGTYNINSKMITLADSDMNKIVYDQKDIQPDVYSVKTELVGGTTPTEAPQTQAPETQAPETQAPETQAPVTEDVKPTTPVGGDLFVVADGVKYPVSKGDVITYNYYLSVDSSLKISSLDINMFYDTEGLDFLPYTDEYGDVDMAKHFPKISGGCVNNFGIDGEIYYNYSSVAGVRLTDNALIFTGQFKVTADKGTYNINSKMITLADSDMNKIVYAEEVIKPDVFSIKTELVGGTTPTEAPQTQAPETQAPETQAPETQAPATTPVVGGDLFVVADGVKYPVSKGDVITYNYYLSVDSSLKISSLDINMFYDTEGLDFLPYTDEYGDVDMAKHFPKISGGCVNNFGIDGEIYYNYSSVAGVRLTDNALIFTGQFEVTADKGTYNINSKLITLADSDMNKIVYDQKDIQPDVYSVKTELVGGTTPETKPTETTPVDDGLYVRVDEKEIYAVKKGDVVTYRYILNVPNGSKISSIDMNTFYDTEGLDFLPYTDEYGDDDLTKHFPKIYGGCVHNFGIDGEIYYNYSNVAGIRLTNDAVMFEGQFKVTADKGTYDINTKLVTLADSDMNKIVYNFEVVQAGLHEEKELLVDLVPGPGPEPELLIGDVNRDGKINVFDVTEIQLYAASFKTLDDEQMIIADTNFDGKVNIFDASAIQRYIAGDITEFTKQSA